jgi:8-oxo-dGTP pyrophosphatase MutT (NUDIX family)
VSATASNIRAAASVLVLRDGPRGMEVLLMRRPERDNDFRSGACVFPGGVLDRGDADAHALCFGLDDAAASARLGLARGGLDYFVAALRECFEEVGLLFACDAGGAPIDTAAHAEALQQWRHRLHRGEASITQLCDAFDWRLDARDMAYFAHWLTPVVRPKRFDTRFFVRLAPPGQEAMPDMGEALELLWLTPDEALDPARGLKLLNVTQRVLRSLHGFADARAAFDHALALRGVQRVFPRPALGRDGPRFVIDSEPVYEEVERLDPDGRGDLRCEIEAGDVLQLSPRLWRIGGDTTNAYVVTDLSGCDALIVATEPPDARQLQVIRERWPRARAMPSSSPGELVAIGSDCHLKVLQQDDVAVAYWLQADGIAIGDLTASTAAVAGIEWIAPTRGFMHRATRARSR